MGRLIQGFCWIGCYVVLMQLRRFRQNILPTKSAVPRGSIAAKVAKASPQYSSEYKFREGKPTTVTTSQPYSEASFMVPKAQVREVTRIKEAIVMPARPPHEPEAPPRRQYRLPETTKTWCDPPTLPPLPYFYCNGEDTVYKIRMTSSLAESLKLILLVATTAFEENRCFYIEQSPETPNIILNRYFEPIGVPEDDKLVERSKSLGRVVEATMADFWDNPQRRRIHGTLNNIPNLYYEDMESTVLKKVMLRRLWRPLPQVQESMCEALEQHGLEQEYLALSYTHSEEKIPTAVDYMEAAQQIMMQQFDGKAPVVYMATDDCSILSEFQKLRPSWSFRSECGNAPSSLNEAKSVEETDQYVNKLLIEFVGLAAAKYYVGVSYAENAWWTAFMRHQRWASRFLDPQQVTHVNDVLDQW